MAQSSAVLPSSSSLLAGLLVTQGRSQADLVRLSGLSRQTVYDAYHGSPCGLTTWIQIARALEVPIAAVSPEAASQLDGVVVR